LSRTALFIKKRREYRFESHPLSIFRTNGFIAEEIDVSGRPFILYQRTVTPASDRCPPLKQQQSRSISNRNREDA
jgi:hypothetical protein